MQINENLNLVVPIRSDDKGVQVYGFHTPISREVFEANYRILSATKSALASKGTYYQMDAGPRITSLTIKDEARKDAAERGDLDESGKPRDDTAVALLAEIKRLTMILAPSPDGWDSIPVDVAIQQKVIDAEEWQEAESSIAFFTCHYAMGRRGERAGIARATASLLKGSSTSSPLSEFCASLMTLTKVAPSVKRAASSVPS